MDMFVIALAALVVVTHHTLATNHIDQAVFDAMRGRLCQRRHFPNDALDRALPVRFPDTGDESCLHGASRALYDGARQALSSDLCSDQMQLGAIVLADKRTEITTRRRPLVQHQCSGSKLGEMKVRDLIAMIEADGWFQVRTRGSHRQFHHPAKTGTVTVSGKPGVDIPPGTLHSALKQAGLKKQE